MLPLHEVLKNLPTASLRMRDDQEEQEAGANFATPFSAKAEEDAKRFNVAGTPVAKRCEPIDNAGRSGLEETNASRCGGARGRKPFDRHAAQSVAGRARDG